MRTGNGWSRGIAAVVAVVAVMMVAASSAWAGKPLGIVPHQGAHGLAPTAPAGVPSHLGKVTQTATQPQLTYHSGHVMHTSTVRVIYWTGGLSMPSGYESAIDTYFGNVAADSGKTSNVYSTATQYTDTFTGHLQYQSTFAGSIVDPTPFVNDLCDFNPLDMCIFDQQIAAHVKSVVDAHSGWGKGSTDAYAVVTPPGVKICFPDGECSDNVFCA